MAASPGRISKSSARASRAPERHSHGVLFVHKGELWTICARFGVGTPGRRFPGLQAEAFVLDEQTDHWESRGIVMKNCWPYDEPVRMANGNFITGGQDKDGLPVVAISHGDDLTQWDSVLIPYDRRLKPSFAETTVWSEGDRVIAVIRGGGGVAWVSTSDDFGRTWSKAGPSNLPMPRAKAYLGKLSTGQLYLLSNLEQSRHARCLRQPARRKHASVACGGSATANPNRRVFRELPKASSGPTPTATSTTASSTSSIPSARKIAVSRPCR